VVSSSSSRLFNVTLPRQDPTRRSSALKNTWIAHPFASSCQTTTHTASLVEPYIAEHVSHYTCDIISSPSFYFPFSAQPSNKHAPSRSLFLHSRQSMHERRQRLGLAPAVAPLDTHSLPPQNNTDRFLDYITVRDCRRRRTFPSLSFFTHIYFVAYLFYFSTVDV